MNTAAERGRLISVRRSMRVGIFAASSIVPPVEFEIGIEHLRANGFEPAIAPQVLKHHFTFAGDDDERASAFFDFAHDPNIDILWAARGGYGAGRTLPILDALTAKRGKPPKKLLVGYSDVTVLHDFVRTRWGWSTLHSPMPAASNFSSLEPAQWQSIFDYVRGRRADAPWAHQKMRWMADAPPQAIETELVGGNLAMVTSVVGTRYQPDVRGKILFLEDTGEPFYRIDRMMVQVAQSGMLDHAAAIVLGDFTDCNDESNNCRADRISDAKKPLRKIFEKPEAFEHIFTTVGRRLGVPIAIGLPVGHGPNFSALPLGAKYQLSREGMLKLLDWDWLNRSIT
jgi:muramoyltetrapeptide carboxypeptidase